MDPICRVVNRVDQLGSLMLSTSDGEKLAEYELDSPPVLDGMMAAQGRLYVAARDGRLTCMGKKQ